MENFFPYFLGVSLFTMNFFAQMHAANRKSETTALGLEIGAKRIISQSGASYRFTSELREVFHGKQDSIFLTQTFT